MYPHTATRASRAVPYLLALSMLFCVFSVGMAQDTKKGGSTPTNPAPKGRGGTKGGSGSTPSNPAPTGPAGAATGAGAGDDKPAQRKWKLANQPIGLLPAAEQAKLNVSSPFIEAGKAKDLVTGMSKLQLVGTLPKAMQTSNRKGCNDASIPWIIQTVAFDPEAADATTPAAVETYLYLPSKPPAKQEDLQKTRIYGSKKGCFALLVYGAVAVNADGVPISDPAQLAGSNAADFRALPPVPKDTKPVAKGGQVFVPAKHAAVGQFYAAKKKTPAPLQDLIYLLQLAGFAEGAQDKPAVKVRHMWLVSTQEIDELPVPSDMWVQCGNPGSAINPTAFKPFAPEVQFDNEGYYWYDFSVTFPLNKVDALEYNENDSIVQTKQVDLKTVYATGNIFLGPADIKDPPTLWRPRLLFGIGLRGKPYDRMFVGAGFGLNKFIKWSPLEAVQPFAGLSFNRVYEKDGSGTAAVLRGREIRKLVVGINVPVKSVVDRLKNSKNSGN